MEDVEINLGELVPTKTYIFRVKTKVIIRADFVRHDHDKGRTIVTNAALNYEDGKITLTDTTKYQWGSSQNIQDFIPDDQIVKITEYNPIDEIQPGGKRKSRSKKSKKSKKSKNCCGKKTRRRKICKSKNIKCK